MLFKSACIGKHTMQKRFCQACVVFGFYPKEGASERGDNL